MARYEKKRAMNVFALLPAASRRMIGLVLSAFFLILVIAYYNMNCSVKQYEQHRTCSRDAIAQK